MTTESTRSTVPRREPSAIDALNFLDSHLRMGEEPDEISYEVDSTSDKCALEFSVWLAGRGIRFPVEGIKILLRGLFEFTYLHNWSRRAAIRNLTKVRIAEFYAPLSGAEFEQSSGLLSPGELLVLFFRYLAETGYEIDAKRLSDQIAKLRPKQPRSTRVVGRNR